MNEENLEHALRIISTRRNSARTQQEERIQEIETRIPEVVEINRQLFRTSRNLLEIIRDGGNVSEQVESLRRQNQQGQAMIRTLLEQHGYPADYLELHYTCEKCQDTGFFQGKTCSCLTELVAKLSAEKLNQSVRFEQCSFENFSLDYYKGLHTAVLLPGIRPALYPGISQHPAVRKDRSGKDASFPCHCQPGAAPGLQRPL